MGAEHLPLRDKIKENIRDGILSGRFAPGERLIEERLADEYGVSRNPIREAIRSLAAEGVIEVTARRGAIVTRLSAQEAQEILEVRATLEGANAKLAARRRDPVILKQLEEVLQHGLAAVASENLDELLQLNRDFHECLALAGHNRVMADLVNTLRARSAPLFRSMPPGGARKTWDEHAAVLRAVLDGDAELSALLAYRHVINAGQRAAAWRAAETP
jgi:DNA-binding GntR family transcriptional regulator